jgi:hypothetical protein
MSRYQDDDSQEQKRLEDEESEYRFFLDNDPDYQKIMDDIEANRDLDKDLNDMEREYGTK